MRIFGRARSSRSAGPRLARSLAAGATLPEIMKEAVAVLLAESEADRAAVWMEWKESGSAEGNNATMFRGVVADQDGIATPAEWKNLSVEAPVVRELLSRGEVMEFELNGVPDGLSMGALLEMRRAVCAPIQTQGGLRGVVFAGARKKQARAETAVVEGLAAELAIAAQLDDDRRRARERQEDVVSATRMLSRLDGSESANAVLANLVENCTKGASTEFGVRAVFAVVGETQAATRKKNRGVAETADKLEFLWRSGDAWWTNALDREPLSRLWRQALESRRVTGNEPGAASRGVGRIVAIPLEAGEEVLGVLMAGLHHWDASLSTLERLELRAAVAAQGLLARKRGREAQQQQDWETALLTASGDAVVLLEPGGKIRRLSHRSRALVGEEKRRDADPRRQRHFAEIFQARERRQIEAWLAGRGNGSAEESPEAESREAELANGIRVRLESVEAPSGEISAVVLKPLDASEAERHEQRAETELRNVIEWLEEGVVLFDERQEIRVMNTRFAQMAGLTPGESTGTRTLHGLVARLANQTAEPDKFAARWLGVAHANDSGVRDEVQLLRPAPRVLERATRPVLDATGGRLGRVEIYRDLTAQRVFHSKLIQTEKLAALGQMVTSIAHELSNPLTSILGYAQRLSMKYGASAPSDEARQIVHEAERATSILKQLLLTSRNSRLERRKLLLNEIVTRSMELQNLSLSTEKANIELDLDPALPPVLGDAGQLQQVLMNLIGNARQAIEETGKFGTIRIRTKRSGGTHAQLEVSDDGPGIPQSILARIFDPFFTTKPVGIGTGLGLSIVLGIVRDHGGQVRVASAPGGGATFSIELPAVPNEERKLPLRNLDHWAENQNEMFSEEVGTAGERDEGALGPWAGSQVMVVEDEATVAQLIADVLTDEGLKVEVLLDGREALRRAATQDYDLVICDMKMPDLDGEQFYRRFARAESARCQRVLFVTGDVLAAHTRHFLERNKLAHLAKPFRVEELTEKVRQVFMETSPRKLRGTKTKVARN